MLEQFIILIVAVSRRMTVRELENVWAYKHCFTVKSIPHDREDKDVNYFAHTYVSLGQQIKNVVMFLINKGAKSKTKSSSSRYMDFNQLQDTARST